MGEAGNLEEMWVEARVKGVRNVMMHMGMMDGKPTAGLETVVLHSLKRVDANRGGSLSHKVRQGERLSKGQLLAEISALFGNVTERIEAPADA